MRKHIILYIITICAVIIFFNTGVSSLTTVKTLDQRTSLEGEWKIKWDDNIKYSKIGYDDSGWSSKSFPASMARYILHNKKFPGGIFWLRKKVFINKSLSGNGIGLILGRIANADETYFNGVKIGMTGQFPPEEFSMWNHPRHYSIPDSIVRFGSENVISVRISYYIYCEVLGTLALTNMVDLHKDSIKQNFTRITMKYIMICLGLSLLSVFLMFFILRRDEEYLYYCLQLLCGFYIVFDTCNYWNILGSTILRMKVLGFFWAALNVAHPIFLHRIYNLKRKKTEIFLWCYLVFIFILLCTISGVIEDKSKILILIVMTITIGIYNLSCHLSALYKKSPYAKLFSIFGCVVILGAIHDGFVYFQKFSGIMINLFGYTPENMIFGYTAASLFTGTALIFIFRFINAAVEVEDLNTSLESFVIENALLYEKLKYPGTKTANLNITSQARDKIETVMTYIKDNYSSDISREGLAASVDIHPDHLGKLFKLHLDKTLGDFIYELRIKDAAKRIAETDESIIDIAFSVGFESLRTFNRVFPKFMNTSPVKYRKMNRKSEIDQ